MRVDLSALSALAAGRLGVRQIIVSVLILAVGLLAARSLSQVDSDLDIIYQEYTLAAVELAHISSDVLRFRVTIIRAVEAQSQQEFESITSSLAEQRARIQHAVDRYAAASLRVSRSGRSEPEDLQAVRASLDAYFAAASKTITMLIQEWHATTPEAAARLHQEAVLHAADNAGPKMIQISLALDRLLETVSDVARDLRDEGSSSLHQTTQVVTIGSILIALFNLLPRRRTMHDRTGLDATASALRAGSTPVLTVADPPASAPDPTCSKITH